MQELGSLLYKIAGEDQELLRRHSYPGLSAKEVNDLGKAGKSFYRGKVRDVIGDGEYLKIVHSDRLSAFDRFIGLVPCKGIILTDVTDFWFQNSRDILPTHYKERLDERTLLVEKMEPVKVEVIVRGYLAGSMMRAYQSGEREFCGEVLPSGLRAFEKLPDLLITPTTKAEVYQHDENISSGELISAGICTRKEWELICQSALDLFRHGEKVYGQAGWILVDTKYEFGRGRNGRIKLIDEAHTPDSSRLWVKGTYEQNLANGKIPDMFDKEIVRRYLLELGFSGRGDVPTVPGALLLQLSQTYLKVAESLRRKALVTVLV